MFFSDDVFPVLTCPASYTLLLDTPDALTVNIPETDHVASASDTEYGVSVAPAVTYTPNQLIVTEANIGDLYAITVKATDGSGNSRECAFTINVEAAPCKDWAITAPLNGIKTCTRNSNNNGFDCVMSCNENYYFYDDPRVAEQTFSCTDGNPFTPSGLVPNCVRE